MFLWGLITICGTASLDVVVSALGHMAPHISVHRRILAVLVDLGSFVWIGVHVRDFVRHRHLFCRVYKLTETELGVGVVCVLYVLSFAVVFSGMTGAPSTCVSNTVGMWGRQRANARWIGFVVCMPVSLTPATPRDPTSHVCVA